jgi:hypothetical protein
LEDNPAGRQSDGEARPAGAGFSINVSRHT